MSQQEKAKACKVYCDGMAAGLGVEKSTEKAIAILKVGHATLDLAWYADSRNTTPSGTPALNVAPADQQEAATLLRAGKGWKGQLDGVQLSWGRITVALGYWNPSEPKSRETEVRNKLSTQTGLSSEGMRIGRGGRYLSHNGAPEPRFYVGNHKKHGVEDAKPRQLDPEQVAAGADTYKPKVIALGARKAAAKKPRAKKPATTEE